MARPRKIKTLGTQKAEVVERNILLENPEGYSDEIPDPSSVIVADKIPEMRRVVFLNGRDPGYPLEFHYHTKTHYLKHYKLLHGYEYELPQEVIEHLENCNEPQYAYKPDLEGHPQMYIKSRRYIFNFKSAKKAA